MKTACASLKQAAVQLYLWTTGFWSWLKTINQRELESLSYSWNKPHPNSHTCLCFFITLVPRRQKWPMLWRDPCSSHKENYLSSYFWSRLALWFSHYRSFLSLELDPIHHPHEALLLDSPSTNQMTTEWHSRTTPILKLTEVHGIKAKEKIQELAGAWGGVKVFKLFIYFLLPVSAGGCVWSACAQLAGCWSLASWSWSSFGTGWLSLPYRRLRRPLCSKWLSPGNLGKL
jgi:hypothetical protein